MIVLGVDGAPRGWLVVELNVLTRDAVVAIEESFSSIMDRRAKAGGLLMVDMPIGLASSGKRACEALVRKAIGPRRSSVFSTPRRTMLDHETYEEANQWGKAQDPAGGGLSKQAWNILPKIREIDTLLTPADQAHIGEAHPELAFTRLRGAPCQFTKKDANGAAERRKCLRAEGLDPFPLTKRLRRAYPRQADFSDDDLLDACALALTAEARLEDKAWRFSDDHKDARGLVMEIWG